jgi:hypothetical protein
VVVTGREEPPVRPLRRFLPPSTADDEQDSEQDSEQDRRRKRHMLQQQERIDSASYSDAYCGWCGFGPDEELPGYVDCPDHLGIVIRGHRRQVGGDQTSD